MSLLLSCKRKNLGICHISVDKLILNLVLKSLALGADVRLEQEKEEMRVEIWGQLFNLG